MLLTIVPAAFCPSAWNLSTPRSASLILSAYHPGQFRYAASLSGFLNPSTLFMKQAIRVAMLDAGGYNVDNVVARATAVLERTTRVTGGILKVISDHDPDGHDVGRYSGWGAGEDLSAPPLHEGEGPSMFPLQYRDDRVWRRTLGGLWFPAIAALITVEDWFGVPQGAIWISLVGLFAAFLLVARLLDQKPI